MDLIELGKKIGVEGFLHCAELDRLVEEAAGKDVLEVGSFKGLSAWGMAFSAKSLRCIDTFEANSAGQQQMGRFTTLDDFERSVARYRSTHVVAYCTTSELAPHFLPEGTTFDFIFLDAMHTYEDVKADIARWWPLVRPGGAMAFHDYGHGDFPGVKQAVDEAFGSDEVDVTVTLRIIRK